MSIGNLKDQGGKGTNFPYQLASVKLLDAILQAILASGPNADREFRITTYRAIANGVGYSINDLISRTDIIDVATGAIISTLWFNETTGLTIAAPPIGDLTPYQPPLSLPTVVRTPTISRVTSAAGSPVAAGARSVSIANTGAANGLVLGTTIKPGEVLTWSAGAQSDTLIAISYDGTGTELLITTVV